MANNDDDYNRGYYGSGGPYTDSYYRGQTDARHNADTMNWLARQESMRQTRAMGPGANDFSLTDTPYMLIVALSCWQLLLLTYTSFGSFLGAAIAAIAVGYVLAQLRKNKFFRRSIQLALVSSAVLFFAVPATRPAFFDAAQWLNPMTFGASIPLLG